MPAVIDDAPPAGHDLRAPARRPYDALTGFDALGGAELAGEADITLGQDVILSAGLAFVTGLIAIALMMSWLRRAGFAPFVLYRLALGAGLLYWTYSA